MARIFPSCRKGRVKILRNGELLKIIKFAGMGILSTMIELLVFYLLQGLVFADALTQPIQFLIFTYEGPGYLWSYLISTAIGYAIAFALNRKYTFQADSNPLFSIIMYIIMVIFTIFATAWLGLGITNIFIQNNKRALGEAITKPLVAVLAMIWTYPINRFVIHRKRRLI